MFGIPSPARLAPTLFFTCGLLAAPGPRGPGRAEARRPPRHR